MSDILIKNAILADGEKISSLPVDIACKNGKIEKIGNLRWSKAKIEIDARGKVIAPGFIDVHNHSDNHWRLFMDPALPSLVHQGVTTIIGGNCGASIAPLTDARIIESIQKWADLKQVNINWLSYAEFREEMEKKNFGVNFATLVGHGTIRRGLVSDEARRLNRNEMEIFKNLLKKSLEAGAFGLSSGLAYSHEKAAPWDELMEFLEIVKEQGRVYSTHIRDEDSEIIPSIEEALDLAQETGVKLQISHLKVMGEKNWDLMDEVLQKISDAHANGVDVYFDVYPYTQTASVLYLLLPDWVTEGGKHMLLRRLREKKIRDRVVEELKQKKEYDYGQAYVAVSILNKTMSRRTIAEIAEFQDSTIENAIVDLLLATEGRVVTLCECLSEENVQKALKHPLSIIATDGSGYDIQHVQTGEIVHPRSFGSFPRVLGKYVREKKILTLEEAIRKMTSLPAERFGLRNRGRVLEGYAADLVIFDPEKIGDLADSKNPYQYSVGIENVIINGKIVFRDGKSTGELAGRFLSL